MPPQMFDSRFNGMHVPGYAVTAIGSVEECAVCRVHRAQTADDQRRVVEQAVGALEAIFCEYHFAEISAFALEQSEGPLTREQAEQRARERGLL